MEVTRGRYSAHGMIYSAHIVCTPVRRAKGLIMEYIDTRLQRRFSATLFYFFRRNAYLRIIMLTISPDSYIRLSFDLMRNTSLVHLMSGLDEDNPSLTIDGAVPTTITGYTEWVSEGSAPLTMGWDWQLNVDGNDVRMERISEPRSNIMLLDNALHDCGPAKTSALLETVIDALAWQDTTLAYIKDQRAEA
jgi:hypothetical protein